MDNFLFIEGILKGGGSLYPVSEAFLTAIQSNSRRCRWSGRITTAIEIIDFEEKDIIKGSGYISSQCCGSTEIELGSVYSTEMGITLFLDVDRYTLEGASIELHYHLLLPNGDYESVPMGIFEVSEANRTIKCLEIKAYDYMIHFEKSFNGTSTTGTAYELIDLCCRACGVEMAQTQEDFEAMSNGMEILANYSENDIETYRDVLYYTGQVLGGFFVINRLGKLELRKFGNDPVMEITWNQRFQSSFSDFITKYTAISSTNMRTQTAEYYALEQDDGLTLNLGVNPMLQFGLEETRKRMCENILEDISVISYVPFDSDTIGNPALDLGDVLRFSGGHADDTQITCITVSQCRIGGKHTLKCVGKNPRLAQAKSKNDKNITGLLNQIEEGKVGFFSFVNAKPYELAKTELQVISIDFAAGEVLQAEFIGLVIMDVNADCVKRESFATGTISIPMPAPPAENLSSEEETTDVSVEVNLPVTWEEDGKVVVQARYVLNGTDIELFLPTQTYGSGKHTFPLYYPVNNVLPNLLNNFSVYFSVTGGTVRIAEGACIATVTGQGLAAEETADWDGILEIEEMIQKYQVLNWFKQGTLVDNVSVKTEKPQLVNFLQTMAKTAMTGLPMIFEDGSDQQ
uniref:Minor structural protein n=1 Tax=Siphoviridae sp. ctquf9 TaxID=2826470 RepID=A0A8S5M4H7_9CAUD|nr:MAG TPA: Minor structural protein [Siphoviridae sp. ctquf9]